MKKLFSKWLSALLIAALLLPCVAVAEEASPVAAEPATGIVADDAVFEADAPEAVEPESEEPIVEDVIDEPDAAPAEDAAPVEDAEEGESASDEDPDAPVEEVIIDSVDEIVSEDDFADLPAEDYDDEELFVSEDSEWESVSSEAMYADGEGGGTPGGLQGPAKADGAYTVNYSSSGEGFNAAVGYDGWLYEKADEGQVLVLYVQSSSFGFSIKDANGNSVESAYDNSFGGYKFTMPASDVYIDITVNSGSQGGGQQGGGSGTPGGLSGPPLTGTYAINFAVYGDGSGISYAVGKETQQVVSAEEGWELALYIGGSYSNVSITTVNGDPVSFVNEGGRITFTMPASAINIGITPIGGSVGPVGPIEPSYPEGDYSITIGESEHGSVSVGTDGRYVTTASEGWWMYVESVPETGYRLGSVTVTCNDQIINEDGGTDFTMPAGDVTVNATFVTIEGGEYPIQFAECQNGAVSASVYGTNVTSANAGEPVDIEIRPADGYHIKSVSATFNGGELPVKGTETIWGENGAEGAKYTYTMPQGALSVSATMTQGDHSIAFGSIPEGCSLFANINGTSVSKADQGEKVALTVWGDDENRCNSLSVKCGNEDVSLQYDDYFDEYYFEMPNGDVTVSATFIGRFQGNLITINNEHTHTNGVMISGFYSWSVVNYALEGEIVSINFDDPETGYSVSGVTVTCNGASVPVSGETSGKKGTFSFTMPNGDVVVTITATTGDAPVPVVKYNLTTEKTGNGTVSAPASAAENDQVEFTVIPDEGWIVDSVTVKHNGVEVGCTGGQDGKYTFIMPDGPVTVSAMFVSSDTPVTSYSITFYDGITYKDEITNGSVAAKVNGAVVTSATKGDIVTLVVTPDEGYETNSLHVYRNGEEVSLTNNTFSMPDGDVAVAVGFSAISYNVTVNETKNGSVDCSFTSFRFGEKVELSVTPADHYELDKLTITKDGSDETVDWTLDGDSYTFIMPSTAVTIEATFKAIQYHVTVDGTLQNGTLTVDKDTAAYGEIVTLTATPSEGFELAEDPYRFTIGGETGSLGHSNGNRLTMPAGDVVVSVIFVKKNYKIHYGVMEYGSVHAKLNGETESAPYATWDESLTLDVEPEEGYELNTLTVTDSNGDNVPVNDNSFTMPKREVTISATFRPIDYAITVSPAANGTVVAQQSGVPVQTAHYHDTVYLNVNPDEGYKLGSLTVAGPGGNVTCSETYGVYDFSMPAGNVTVSATFVEVVPEQTYTINVEYNENGEGYAKLNEEKVTTAKAGTTLSFSFYPHDGYEPVGASVKYSNGEQYAYIANPTGGEIATFEMPADNVTITLEFKAIQGGQQGGGPVDPSVDGYGLNSGCDADFIMGDMSQVFKFLVDGQEVSRAKENDEVTVQLNYDATQCTLVRLTWTFGDETHDLDPAAPTFAMPAGDVSVRVRFTNRTVYTGAFAFNYNELHGSSSIAQVNGNYALSANAGDFVTVYVTEPYGWICEGVTVTYGDTTLNLSNYQGFTMPAQDVTITPVLTQAHTGRYNIQVMGGPQGGGNAYVDDVRAISADPGEIVELRINANVGCKVTGATVSYNGTTENLTADNMTFTMPEGDVSVTPEFASDGIIINDENFPDKNLQTTLKQLGYGVHMEGSDYVISAGMVGYLEVNNVEDYTGLDQFTKLNRLVITGNEITTLTLSHPTLTSVMLANCENLTSVDLSGCPNLNDVNFEWNTPKIASLDVSGCTKLTSLLARGAALTELDVSHNTELVKLDCNSNQLTELDVSNNTKLETLSCFNNNIKELNLANNPEIQKYVDDQYKQNINDTQEGYTCIAYVNPNADPWDAWVLAHDHGVEITLVPVFAIAKTVTENGANGTIDAPASASANQTVTVTLTPDENSVAGEIKVAFGETEVPATFADGKYTFTMPEGDVTITATFKKRPKVEAPVAAENLTYDGSEQALVVAGTTDGGTLQYSLDSEAWSEDIPVGKAAGDYEVYYRVLGNGDFGDYAAEAPVAVAIAKAKATVTIDKKKTYGDNDPDTSDYTVDGLVSGDSLTGDPEREKGENVKRYAYNAGTLDNPNYDITVEGELTILPKEISAFEWSEETFTYNGKAQLPTATISEGLVEGDECSVTVVAKDGDDATEAGDHTAIVVSLSNGNYKLPKTAIEHTYTIEKADHEDVKDGVQFAVSANGVENGQADLSQYIPEDAEWFVTGCDNKLITAAEIKTGDEKSRILTYTAVKAAADVTEGCVELEIKEKDYNPYDLIVKFVTSDVFTLSFDSKGGDPVDSLKLHQGVPYGELPVIEREFYEFQGWVDSANNEVTAETEMGAGDTTIFAKWEAIEYTIALDNGEHGTIPIEYLNGEIPFTIESDAFDLPKLEDVEGYTFSGWKLGDEIAYTDVRIDPAEALKTMPEDNTIRYTAQWVAGNTVGKVAFAEPDDVLSGILGIKDMDAEASTDGESNSNSLAETLKQVAADNSDSEIPDGCESRTITVEMQVSATGIREEDKGLILEQVGEPAVKDVDVKTDFLKIDINQTTSYTAAEGGNTQDPETTTLTDLNRVVEIPLNYDMTGRYNLRLFRKHGDSVEPFTKRPERPRSGKDMQDGTFFVSGYGASAVIYIYSDRFSTFAASTDNRESFEVNFVSNGGSEVAAQTVYKNEKVTKPADPTRAATATVVYTFDAWYTDEALTEKYDFDATPVTEAFTLYAGWKETAVANNTAPTTTAPAPAPAPEPAADPILTIISNKKNVKATVEVGKVYQIDLLGKSGKGYKSSKKKLATVSSTGLVTPKNAGKVKITFKVGKKKRTITLKVVDPTVPKSIALSLAGTVPAKVGEPQTLTYTLPAGSESGVKWKTSNKKIATVNNGVVTFKKAGTVTITATCTRGKKKAKVKFKVSK